LKQSFSRRLKRDLRRNAVAYLMVLAVIAYYVVFHYLPMGGILMDFKDFKPRLGIWASKWVGFYHFESFFSFYYFWRLIRNTLTISIAGLIFTFPCAIVFALVVNEVKHRRFKNIVLTISYIPHFISIIVVCSMMRLFLSSNGFVFELLKMLGYQGVAVLLSESSLFVSIYIISDIWQQTFHVTLPGIARAVILLTILRIGTIMSVGHKKSFCYTTTSQWKTRMLFHPMYIAAA